MTVFRSWHVKIHSTKPTVSLYFNTNHWRPGWQYYPHLYDLGFKPSDVYLFSFVHHRFAILVPFYGLVLHLQYLGSNIFLFQALFGIVTLPANYVALLALNHLGRRVTQMLLMFLLGIFILAITSVPPGEKRAQIEERSCLPPISQGMYSHLLRSKGKG